MLAAVTIEVERKGFQVEKLSLSGTTKHSTDDTMRGLSALFVDGETIFVDNGAIHAKSRLEKNMTFVKSREEVPEPRLVWGFWITLHRFEGGQGYYGAIPFELWIDDVAGVAFKSLAQQVNGMEKAVKGKVEVGTVPKAVRQQMAAYLQSVRPELWENAATEFCAAFTS